jgi:hypothetical protein
MIKNIIALILYILITIGNNVICFQVKISNNNHRSIYYTRVNMKSKDELEIDRQMLKLKALEVENNREMLRLRAVELALQAEKLQQEQHISNQKLQQEQHISNQKLQQEEKIEKRRIIWRYSLLTLLSVLFYLFGVQLRDGLLGRFTTFNSIVNELKLEILKRLTSLNIFFGLLISKEYFYNSFMKACTFLRKITKISF